MDSPDLLEDKIKVTGKNGILAVENLTEENLGMVYVRYKYFLRMELIKVELHMKQSLIAWGQTQ